VNALQLRRNLEKIHETFMESSFDTGDKRNCLVICYLCSMLHLITCDIKNCNINIMTRPVKQGLSQRLQRLPVGRVVTTTS
jgi:hypothetical protein